MRSKGVGGARARQASPRALAIGGGIALLIIIAIVLGVILSGGSNGKSSSGEVVTQADMANLPTTGSAASGLPGSAEANNLFNGIKQNGLTLGNPKAPVTMEMFIDVQCPVCDNYEVYHLPGVVTKYIRPGKVQLHLKPWAFLGGQGSQSFSGRLGLIAASKQNKGFEYAKVLYDNQGQEESGWLTGAEMATIAASVNGLNMSQWRNDTNSSSSQAVADGVDKLAAQKKVTGTPTILIGPTGGKLQVASGSTYDPTGVEQALAAAVANAKG